MDDLAAPNGLAFSPDESVLYVVESRATPNRLIWARDVALGGMLSNKRLHIGAGALDGMAVDAASNRWCGFGTDGRPGAPAQGLDDVWIFDHLGRLRRLRSSCLMLDPFERHVEARPGRRAGGPHVHHGSDR